MMASDNKKSEPYILEPTAPITKKGILMSFLTGESMSIPDQDVVFFIVVCYLHFLI